MEGLRKRDSMRLADVEERFDVRFPTDYRALEPTGLLAPRANRSGPNHPPLLSVALDLELLTPAGIADRLEWLRDPDDYLQVEPALGLLPFATSGAGDPYVFVGSMDDCVGMLWHDADDLSLLAPDLATFVVRCAVEAAASLADWRLADLDGFRDDLRGVARTHAALLDERQRAVVSGLADGRLVEWTASAPARSWTESGLIDGATRQALLTQLLGERWIGRSIPSSRP